MNQDGMPQENVPEQEAAAAAQETPDAQQAPEAQAAAPDAAEWQQKLGEAEQKIEEYLSLAQRVQADFDNFRRRNSAVRAEAYEDGRRDTVKELLPVLDNIERALASAGEEESALKTGVEMVHRGLMETLKRMGVEAIDRLGEPFDPELENAVLQGGEDEGEPGTVCAVLQKGYRLGNRVLRHAMVKVVAG
ncbi:MAG TPA: nucleotide exchange factor GrpE [Candidatus Onthenecus intestinigallinarum]|uniref:Protein GrpE n=1 Tax=Candidatus Onthenecus intestinigallinarum TaxID=2840875 RepID=A0A9D0ZA68_9FIRM|nr:nucleotide exchange factor GrpE [Candidatus Onthenecus intestinigallinarum]